MSGDLDGELVVPSGDISVMLCDTVDFVFRMASTQIGNIKDVEFEFTLPNDLNYVPGSYEVAYPVPFAGGDTTFVHFEDPFNIFGTTLIDTVTEHYGQLDSFGLIGSPGAIDNSNIILARFKGVTDCGYASGSLPLFRTRAVDACTNPTVTVSAPGARVIINNALPEYEINVDIGDLTLNPCQDDAATIEIDMEILADAGVFTQNSDSIFITLPPGIEYTVGSYQAISNANGSSPIVEDVNGQSILKLPLQGGLGNGDIVNFEFDIMAVDIGQLCEVYEILVQTLSVRSEMCGAMTCDIKVISGSKASPVSIQKPDLTIDVVSLAFVTAPPGELTYIVEVTNDGAVPQLPGDPINIELYNDADANGFLDPSIDNLVTTIPEGVSILPGETVTITGSVDLPPDGLCTVLAQISSETTCTCSSDVSNQTSVEIINDFEMEIEVCSGEIANIGPAAIGGYDYEWVPVGTANLTALSSTTTTPIDFEFDNTTGSNIEWQYALRSSFSTCFSFDTLSITLFPDNDQVINPQACEGLPFTIPGPSMGSDFSWTPTTDLDDPNSMFPTLSNVPAGMTTYTLDYIDDNGCETIHEVNITAITCAPNTAIGDTVWFDLNENGLQDIGEPGIPGVTVFLYNSTNTSPGNQIGVTMTDANGFYIFENIPSGNYVVGFEFPEGFVPTSTDTGGDDTRDSDADMASGLTGNYFIPNGMANLTVDAGFIPDCSIKIEIVDVGECNFIDPGHDRTVTLDVSWLGAVYTSDFLGGVDTIEINVLGQLLKIGIDEVDGDTTITFIMPGGTAAQDIIALANFELDPDCTASDEVLDVSACIYDVALIKTLPAGFMPMYNTIVPFTITIENQGAQPLNNVKITDFLPVGYTFDPADNIGWMESAPGILMYTLTDIIDPMEVVDIPLNVTLVMSGEPEAYLNIAEITSFTDTLDVDRSNEDIDSTPDSDPNNDPGGLANSGSDNALNGDGTGTVGGNNPNTDEDDSDPELLQLVDLALQKNILTPGPYSFGQTVTFEIIVFNQGNIDVQNVVVNDNIPAGYSFASSNDLSVWSHSSGVATTTIPGPIPALSSTTVTLDAVIEMAGSGDYVNVAEIESFENLSGIDITSRDLDSVADNNPDNDAGGLPDGESDGAINGDGTGAAGDDPAATDEDDMDIAFLSIPLLEIEKSTTAIVEASSGVVGNFDVTFEIEMINEGTTKLNNIKLQDDLVEQIGGTFIGIVTPPSITSSTATIDPTVNPGYNGAVIDSIFTGIDGCLGVDEQITVEFTIEVSAVSGADINEAVGMAVDSLGVMVMDQDTAMIAVPVCFLEVECPLLDQGTFVCSDDVPAAATDIESFNAIDSAADIDNFCSEPTVTVVETMAGTGCSGDPLVITRTYTITDAGEDPIGEQSVTCTVEYTVIDDVKPIIMVPPGNLTVDCSVAGTDNLIENWITDFGGSQVIDGCSDVEYTFEESGTLIVECGGAFTQEYTLTATDECGNSISEKAYLNNVGEEIPDPDFSLAEEVCWDGIPGSLVLEASYTASSGAVSEWAITPTTTNALSTSGILTINEAGTFEICLTETVTYDACATAEAGECVREYCQSITITNSTEIDPSWQAIGPYCEDGSIVDLNVLVTGDTGGVFSGTGVSGTHPNYTFNIATAGVGVHDICYTLTSAAGCTAVQCNSVEIFESVNASINDVALDCDASSAGQLSLSSLFGSGTTTGGNFSIAGTTAFTTPWINEIDYDNSGTDNAEFVEIAGPAGFDLSTCELVLYNGGNNSTYGTIALSGTIPNEAGGVGTISTGTLATNSLQNGVEGIALVCNGAVIEFLSYEGVFTAANGPAMGMTSVDIGVVDAGLAATAQNTQNGPSSGSTWTLLASTEGTLNTSAGQGFGAAGADGQVVGGSVLQYNEPGCFEITYSVSAFDGASGSCVAINNAFVLIPEQPDPAFQIQDAICLSAGDAAAIIQATVMSPSYINAPVVTWSVNTDNLTNATATVDANGAITITPSGGDVSGTVAVTLTEEITNPACGTLDPVICEVSETLIITVQDGTALDACFTVTDSTPCIGETVSLLANTAGGVFSGQGVTDDGNGSTGSVLITSCNIVTVTYTLSTTSGCTNSCSQSITPDTTPPVIVTPLATSVECDGAGNNAQLTTWLGGFSASSNCGSPTTSVQLISSVPNCANGTTLTYQFNAVDACGSITTTFSNFTIEDTTAPVLTVPNDMTVECTGSEDDSGDDGGSGGGADDPCDGCLNARLQEQGSQFFANFQLQVFNTCTFDTPSDVTAIITGSNYSLPNIDGTNGVSHVETGVAPNITHTFTFPPINGFNGNRLVQANGLSNVVVTGNNGVPTSTGLELNCSGSSGTGGGTSGGGSDNATDLATWLASATATDVCSDNVTINSFLDNTISGCGGTESLTYRFEATDDCGLVGIDFATFTIEDTTDPIVECPDALDISCGDTNNDLLIINWLDSATGMDDCGTVTFTDNFNGTLPSNCGGVITVMFTGTDACGNSSTCNSTISMDDNEAPNFVNCPDDITVNADVDLCGSNPIFSTPNAIDNCGVTVAQTSGIASGNTFPLGATAIEFTATDECGNPAICTFDITVVDSEGLRYTLMLSLLHLLLLVLQYHLSRKSPCKYFDYLLHLSQ
ncbi:HYR domain-containing protein [Saprospiraceae bacterium]|nr:HYR domain-containing protein [Saprospiraceae bacterium]